MLERSMAMSFNTMNFPTVFVATVNRTRTQYRSRSYPSAVLQPSVILQTDDIGNVPESKRIWCQTTNSLLSQSNTVGIIGGVSVFSTLIFLEKLVWWSTRDGEDCVPFVVCSDPALNGELPIPSPRSSCINKNAEIDVNGGLIVENLRLKRAFLEQSGAGCIVMPCHLSHAWHSEISEGCQLPFFHVGESVARELKEAKLKPLEAGSDVRIGVLGTDTTSMASFYEKKLLNQGFEVVLPDKGTMERIIGPAIEALHRKDMEGARNLLRIAIQMLLVRAVSIVIIASDQLQCVLPPDDPLLKKCIDPMDSLARETIKWAKSTTNVT